MKFKGSNLAFFGLCVSTDFIPTSFDRCVGSGQEKPLRRALESVALRRNEETNVRSRSHSLGAVGASVSFSRSYHYCVVANSVHSRSSNISVCVWSKWQRRNRTDRPIVGSQNRVVRPPLRMVGTGILRIEYRVPERHQHALGYRQKASHRNFSRTNQLDQNRSQTRRRSYDPIGTARNESPQGRRRDRKISFCPNLKNEDDSKNYRYSN